MLNADFLFQHVLKTNSSSSPNALLLFNPEVYQQVFLLFFLLLQKALRNLQTSKNKYFSQFSLFFVPRANVTSTSKTLRNILFCSNLTGDNLCHLPISTTLQDVVGEWDNTPTQSFNTDGWKVKVQYTIAKNHVAFE